MRRDVLMGAPISVSVHASVAWWLRLYLYGVVLTAWLTGAQPDQEKVMRVAKRAIRLEVR